LVDGEVLVERTEMKKCRGFQGELASPGDSVERVWLEVQENKGQDVVWEIMDVKGSWLGCGSRWCVGGRGKRGMVIQTDTALLYIKGRVG
jgi:hypothetical protein